MDDFDPIEQSKRYVFGETDSFYGVWDKQGDSQLVEQFALTDEGFERASALFDQLKRRDRSERGLLLSVLWFAILAGAVLMVGGGLLELLGTILESSFLARTNFVFYLSNTGYNVVIGGLALLVGLTVIRREARRPRNDGSASPGSAPGLLGALWWVMIAGLIIWVLSTVLTHVLFQYVGPGFGGEPDTGAVVAGTIESLAFRIWVSAFAMISARWLLAPRQAGDAEAAE